MRILNIKSSLEKKVRGLKRKTNAMVSEIVNSSTGFPDADLERGYWHMHLPTKQAFIDSKKIMNN